MPDIIGDTRLSDEETKIALDNALHDIFPKNREEMADFIIAITNIVRDAANQKARQAIAKKLRELDTNIISTDNDDNKTLAVPMQKFRAIIRELEGK